MSDHVAFWSKAAWHCVGAVVFAWIAINSVVLVSAMRDRTSGRKHFQEQHGQRKLAYWVAKFCHDFIFYLPVAWAANTMIGRYDDYMEYAPTTVALQPLVTLPLLYVCSFMFTREATAVITLFFYQVLFVALFPYVLVAVRLNPKTEAFGDAVFRAAKVLLPGEAATSSLVYNTSLLAALGRFRDQNDQGLGDPVVLDEGADMNGKADVKWILIHCAVFWAILLLLLEWRLPCMCCWYPATRFR